MGPPQFVGLWLYPRRADLKLVPSGAFDPVGIVLGLTLKALCLMIGPVGIHGRNKEGSLDAMDTDEAFERLVELAQETGVTLGTAESMTGGRLAHLLSRQEGSGDALAGAIVAYQTRVKQDLLGVPEGPVVSDRAAEAMASGARRLLGCDLVVSITGVAGPDRQDGQPVGCVFIGAVFREEPASSSEHFFEGSPDDIRQSAAVAAATVGHELLSHVRRA